MRIFLLSAVEEEGMSLTCPHCRNSIVLPLSRICYTCGENLAYSFAKDLIIQVRERTRLRDQAAKDDKAMIDIVEESNSFVERIPKRAS